MKLLVYYPIFHYIFRIALLNEGALTSLAFKLFEKIFFFAPGPLRPEVLPTCKAVIASLPCGKEPFTIRIGSIKLFGSDSQLV